MSFRHVTMTVNGEEVTVDLDAELGVGDLSEDMDKVAAQMGYWGTIWAAAEAERERVDTHYRSWRARLGEKLSAGDKSPPEWKVRQSIEAEDKFLQYKEAVAKSIGNATQAKVMYDAYRSKASILQSKGAMMRAELEAGGMSTRASVARERLDSAETRAAESEDRERKKSAIRDINKKKKSKATADSNEGD